MLKAILESEIESSWGKVEPLVIESCIRSRGKYSSDDIRDMLTNRHAQLWIWESDTAYAVIITKIIKYPQNKCCAIWIATGNNFEEWATPSLKKIEQFAKIVACDAMEIIARPGWEKVLPDYDKTHIYLEKHL